MPPALMVARQLDQERLAALSQRAEKLILSNNQLRADTLRNEKAQTDMIAHYQTELGKKDEIIADLQNQLSNIRQEYDEKLSASFKAYESEIMILRSAVDSSGNELLTRLLKAESELDALEEFRHEKDNHNSKIRALEERISALTLQFESEMDDLEKKYIAEKIFLVRAHDEEIAKVKEKALEEAQEILRGQQITILAENERLFHDLRCHLASSKDLQRDHDVLTQENIELKRNIEILKDKEQTYVQTAHLRSNEIRKLRAHGEELENALKETRRDLANQNNEIKATLGKDLEETTLDAAGLRILLQYKNKELKDIKALATTILNQRREVETFFLEALHEVRLNWLEEMVFSGNHGT